MKRTFNLFSLAMILAVIASLRGMPPIPAYAQSTIEHVPLSLPAGWSRGYLYDVWGSGPHDVYAVGHAVDAVGDNVPLLYHNDGTGWIEASPPLAAGWGGGHLYGVWGSSGGEAYAVGEGYNQNGTGPLLYHNDGTGWTEATPSLPAGWSGGSLIDVWGSSASDVYAVGWSNGPLLYHNDGTGWTEVGSSVSMRGYLHGVWGSSASDVYVVGTSANKPVLYHNDGTGWTDVSPSLPAGWSGGRLEGVWGSSVTDVYAIGSGINALGHGVPLLYHNDGSGWSGANLSLPDGWTSGNLYGVGGSSPYDVYVVGFGAEASGRAVPLLYHNDGIGWAEASPALPTGWRGGELYSVWGSSASDLYVVGVGSTANYSQVPLLYERGAATLTATNTPTNTATATQTPTNTSTASYTSTPTLTPTTTNTNTPTATPSYSYNPLYLSLTSNQTIGGIASADEDILRFDGSTWSLFFDGSDVGVGSTDLFGFSFLDTDSLLLSFTTALTLNGISVTPQDIVRFDATSLGSVTAGTFSMYLDGSDVGLDTTAEKIDSISLLPDGRVLISTTGNPTVVGITAGRDEDVLAFTPTSLGDITSGNWGMYFDGSDVGLAETSGEDVDALDVVGGKIYLSTADNFTVNGVAGADEDVFVCTPTSLGDVTACNYSSALYFDGSTWGLSANDVDAFNFLSLGPTPPGAATLISPSGSIATNNPTYTWNKVSGATWYYLKVDGSSGNVMQKWYDASAICGSSTCSVKPTTVLSGGAYTWWVQTWNDAGYGPWSAGMNFSISGPTPTYTGTPTSTPTVTQTPTLGSPILPDLTIISMSITLQNTSCYTPGDPYGVRVWIRNDGQTAAGSFVVNVNGATQTVHGLGVAETKAVFFPGTSNPVTATVDSMNTVAESNENNNTRSEMLPVPTQPLPCPTPTFTPTYTATPTAIFTPTFTNTPASSDLIFADGFESGNLSAWSSSSTDLGDLSVSAAAALTGSQGLQAVIDDNNSIYITDDSPNTEPRYRARFYFDPNSIPMASGDAHFIFKGFVGTSTEALRVEFRQSAGAYQLRASLLDDGTTWINTNWFTISDATHFIELDWRAATAVGANNGGLALWIDGIQQANLSGVDNDTRRIDRARLGALTGIDAGTYGTYYFDAFESRRQGYIGP